MNKANLKAGKQINLNVTICTDAKIVSYTCNELRCQTSENKKNLRNLCFSSGIEKKKKKQMKQFIQRGKKKFEERYISPRIIDNLTKHGFRSIYW